MIFLLSNVLQFPRNESRENGNINILIYLLSEVTRSVLWTFSWVACNHCTLNDSVPTRIGLMRRLNCSQKLDSSSLCFDCFHLLYQCLSLRAFAHCLCIIFNKFLMNRYEPGRVCRCYSEFLVSHDSNECGQECDSDDKRQVIRVTTRLSSLTLSEMTIIENFFYAAHDVWVAIKSHNFFIFLSFSRPRFSASGKHTRKIILK